jgi:hypothetical protein
MAGTDGLLPEEREQLFQMIQARGVGPVAHELGTTYHDVVDAALGDPVDASLVGDVRRLLAR